jgi:peptidoglycan/LPS O-acetylase OafA/YrhL
MPTRRKPKPKPPKQWLAAAAGAVAAGMQGIYTFASAENIQWLVAHGGRVYSLIGAVLAIASCVHQWWPDKTKK